MTDYGESWRTNPAWRDDYVFWTARQVSKCGSMGVDDVLPALGKALSRDEVLWFYDRIAETGRCKGEWRDEFLGYFPQITPDDLPPIPPESEKPEPLVFPSVPGNPSADPDGQIPF